jgi:hypothetical protein
VASKLKIVLLVVLLFGAPALVTTALLTTDFSSAVADGAQPGGILSGIVVDADGRGIGGMEVELASISASGQRTSGPAGTTASDGAFELCAPPAEGHYEIKTGGGDWQRSVQAYSFVDASGQRIEAKPLRIVLRPGCRLELEFVGDHARAVGDGEYTLQGEFGERYFFGLVKPQVKVSGAIKDGRISIAGLPAMKADIFVRMSTGETVELTLELAPGMNRKRIQL